jgi:uncharacterized protein (DUF1684 family)
MHSHSEMRLTLIFFIGILLNASFVLGQDKAEEELFNKAHMERVEAYRKEMDEKFKDSIRSPLLKEDIEDFEGLEFYDADPAYRLEATFNMNKKQKKFKMKTTTDRRPAYIKYAKVKFELKGQEYVLNVYQNQGLTKKEGYEDYLFIPFTDLSNGESTYGGGRYIDIRVPKGDLVEIDLNLAYNPYCTYNYNYSCPIVPLENHLPTRVEAGVLKYKEH